MTQPRAELDEVRGPILGGHEQGLWDQERQVRGNRLRHQVDGALDQQVAAEALHRSAIFSPLSVAGKINVLDPAPR